MEKNVSLEHLLQVELRKLVAAEKLTYQGLSEMIEECSSKELLELFTTHREITAMQQERLKEAMELFQPPQEKKEDLLDKSKEALKHLLSGSSSEKETSKTLKHLLEEGKKTHKDFLETKVADLALASCAILVERFESALYSTTIALADGGNYREIAKILRETFKEEETAAELLEAFVKKELKHLEGTLKHKTLAHA